jgi:hypothetical protein
MTRSLFLEFLDEEASIPKGGKGVFGRAEDVVAMLKAREALAQKMDAAKASGQLTQDQYDQLAKLNRAHSLPAS